jgi:hypothetical protein
MILFYNKKTGGIFSWIHGRVHNESQLKMYTLNPGMNAEDIGKHIVGFIEKDGSEVECNIHQIDFIQKFEDITEFSPLDCKIIDGNIIKN